MQSVCVRRALLIANPCARGYARRKVAAIAAALAARGVAVETALSGARGDVTEIVRRRGADFDVVAVHGGDGTINEAVAGIVAIEGSRPALALAPAGTANVLAHETGAPSSPAGVAAAIAAGRTVPLHYGLANGRPFVLMASAGFDAAVVRGTPSRLKAALGKWSYVVTALRLARGGRTPDLLVSSAGETRRCRLAICANSARYGGDFVVARGTAATRPGLELLLVGDDRVRTLLRIGWLLLRGRPLEAAGVRALAVDEATIEAADATPVQIDGDACGATPVRAQAAAEPLRLVVAG